MMTTTHHKFAVRSLLCTLGISLMLLMPASPVGAQDRDARIKRLENELETLSRAVFKGERPPPGSLALGEDVSSVNAANTELRLQQLEVQLRELTGRIEESNYTDQQFQARVDQALAAMEMRLNALEVKLNAPGVSGMGQNDYGAGQTSPSYGGVSTGLQNLDNNSMGETGFETRTIPLDEEGAAAGSEPSTMGQLGTLPQPGAQANTYPSAPPLAANDPVGLYEQAYSYLREQNYPQAESGFKQFLTEYPQHDLAANAQYWLGESYYVRSDFELAARTFAEAYQKYPHGPKGPDNLLKLGMSLSALGKKDDACLTYAQLRKEYPNGSMPILSRVEQEVDRLGCQQF